MSGTPDRDDLTWHKVAEPDDLPRAGCAPSPSTVAASPSPAAGDRYGALDNHCPHQGGPLGEGSIENGCCAARGTATTTTPSPASRPPASPTPRRASPWRSATTACTSPCPPVPPHVRTVGDVMVETLVAWGVTHVFGMVGHSNLGFADAMRRAEAARRAHLRRHPPRGRGRVRRVGVRQAHRPARGVLRHRRARLHQPAHRPLRRQGRPGPGASPSPARCPPRCSAAAPSRTSTSTAAFADVAVCAATVLPGSDHAELATLAAKHAVDGRGVAHLVLPDEVQEQPSRRAGRRGPTGRVADRRTVPPADAADRRPLALVAAARRPVIVVGHGARCAVPEVLALAERARRPGAHDVQGQGPGAATATRSVPGCSGAAARRWPAG